MATTLVVNPGSNSKKYALYSNREVVLSHRFELTRGGFEACTHTDTGAQVCNSISNEEYNLSFERVARDVKKFLDKESRDLDAICIRIVAPGSEFQAHKVIDSKFIEDFRRREMSVPLHIPYIMQEIQYVKNAFPKTKLVAASDSAFHSTIPGKAREFSIDRSDAETYDIYRFGYHGLSVASIIRRIHPVTGDNPSRVIVCHVGGGVSVNAIKDGKSVDTTMGYSPSSGLPMGSRAGDIDPGGLLQLMRSKNLKPSEAEMYINTKGGLLGLSEISDIRHLLDRKSKGDAVAIQTLDHFVYHIQKAIVGSTVALGGLDMLVLTGTAAERSGELRSMIVEDLEYLGVSLDADRNDLLAGQDGVFSTKKSSVKTVVIKTDEMGEMAQVVDLLDLPKD